MGQKVPPSRVLGAHTGTRSATPRMWTPTRRTECAAPWMGAHAWDRMWHSAQVGAHTGIKQKLPHLRIGRRGGTFYTRVALRKIQKGGIFRHFLHFLRILDPPLFGAPSQIEGAFTTAP